MFPNNDKVVVNVFDPNSIQAYERVAEENFEYRHITGTALDAQDDWVTTISTPFSIKFGGSSHGFETVTIGSNGALSVTNTESIEMSNQEMPVSKYVSLIAPYWDDLNPLHGGGDVYHETLGEAPNREFVVEWRDIHHYSSQGGATFQVVFFENSSDILFNYLDVDMETEEYSHGKSATIGVQSTKDRVVQVSHNTESVQSNSAIRFRLAPPPETAEPAPPAAPIENPIEE